MYFYIYIYTTININIYFNTRRHKRLFRDFFLIKTILFIKRILDLFKNKVLISRLLKGNPKLLSH